jgi:four helix bundle suffix protein
LECEADERAGKQIYYRDFLRTRKYLLWEKDSKEAVYVRTQSPVKDNSMKFRDFAETRSAEIVANIAVCLIHQANYLLDRQLKRLEQDFLKEGGLRERMHSARTLARDTQDRSHESHRSNETH